MFNLEEIKQIYNELSTEYGDTFDIPVYAGNLATGVLGETRIINGRSRRQPQAITLSKTLLEYGTREQVIGVAKHEWVHYYLAKRQHYGTPHDAAFKAMANRIGISDKAKANIKNLREHLYKYTLYCPKCGCLGGYNKMCKTLENISKYECCHCGSDKLYYIKNF